MNELILHSKNLPTTIEDLSKFALIGREKMTAVRAEIRAIDKLGLAEEVRQQKLDEAQMISEAVLDAEVKIGTLTTEIPKATNSGANQYQSACTTSVSDKQKSKSETIRDLGFTPKQVERFEKLAKYPEIVEQAKAEARENDDIVSRSFVLEKIRTVEREQRREEIQTAQPKPITGKYSVIYADPPWRYEFAETKSRAIENQYPTMLLEDIKSIQVPCEDNSILFLWATAPKLEEAMQVMTAWGFTYRTCAIWDKEKIGMGYWFRGQHELLLVGVKGRFSTPSPESRVSSVHREPRVKHSKKPDYYYSIIESMFPNGSYLELFARQKYNDRWEVWGNQI